GYIGDGATAVQHAEQGVRLSPLDARLFWHEGLLAQAHYVNRDYEQALEWGRSALERNESIRYNIRTLTATLVALGRKDEAAEAAPNRPHDLLGALHGPGLPLNGFPPHNGSARWNAWLVLHQFAAGAGRAQRRR